MVLFTFLFAKITCFLCLFEFIIFKGIIFMKKLILGFGKGPVLLIIYCHFGVSFFSSFMSFILCDE